jgi:L-phenylalanine/L-methionine N-acetyltransferase
VSGVAGDTPPPWTLRRARVDDAPAFVRVMADPAVARQLMQLPYPDEASWRQRLTAQVSANGQSPELHLVAEVDGEVIGSAGLHPVGPHLRRRHTLSLGMAVSRPWWGRGVGSALMGALCDYADQWLGALRIELTVFADNAPAQALYRRHGFEVEGRMRAYALRDGVFEDVLMMARLNPAPPVAAR